MGRRFEPNEEKYKNSAAIAPDMPAAQRQKSKPEQVIQKIYIREPRPGEFYGVPKLALIIINLNFGLWLCGLVTIWTAGHASAINIVGGVIFAIAAFLIWLAIQFLIYKMYWWLLALSVSLTSLALIYLYIALLTGSVALQQIQLPHIAF